jgi:hypothetical protein
MRDGSERNDEKEKKRNPKSASTVLLFQSQLDDYLVGVDS